MFTFSFSLLPLSSNSFSHSILSHTYTAHCIVKSNAILPPLSLSFLLNTNRTSVPLLSLWYASSYIYIYIYMHVCVSMWWCKSVTNGLNTMIIWSMKDMWNSLVKKKITRFQLDNIYSNYSNRHKIVSCSYSHDESYKKLNLTRAHKYTRRLHKTKSIWWRLWRCYLFFLIFMYV